MNRRAADLVIRDGRWINVCSGEIIDHTDIAILGSRIAYCGPDARSMIGENTKVFEAEVLHQGLRACSCPLNNAFMTFSLLALPVIPELRLTDLGLVDVASQSLVTLF